jgi:hypothetical protein
MVEEGGGEHGKSIAARGRGVEGEAKRRGTVTQTAQRNEHREHREERKRKEGKRRKEERRGTVVPDRESPPFPPKAGEGWATLKLSTSLSGVTG